MSLAWSIEGGRVLVEDGLADGAVALDGGVIANRAPPAARRFDARGLCVMPGLVDIHGDAHERQLQPRPGIGFPVALAMRDSAMQLLAAGITTAYLGVTLSWEPGLRSREMYRALLPALAAARAESPADLRVHLRFEADNFDALDDAIAGIEGGAVHLLGFNDHTLSIVKGLDKPNKVAKYAERAGVPADRFAELARAAAARRDEVPAARERLAAAARSAGIPMLSHDDATVAQRDGFRALGSGICEFPTAEIVARDAKEKGEPVVMGAPNVVRGGSHIGWASAAPLAEEGVVTILASDYYWPALFEAAFVLAARRTLDLARAWALVSANPARALGLADRGRIAPGLRGDIVVVDEARRAPVATFAQGQLAWIAPEAAARIG